VAEYSVSLSDISVQENLLSDIVFNNPVSEMLRIKGLQGGRNLNLQILDLSGRLLYQEILGRPMSTEAINLTFLPKGVYLIHIQDDLGAQTTQKLVKSAY